MIIDSHCHAWERWPYQPPVPDDQSRGRIEQLLHEMDQHSVEQAVLICAQIDHNSHNNAYIARESTVHRDRIHQFADVDSHWSPTYHTAGAADRLLEMLAKWSMLGFTHYLDARDDGEWLHSQEGNRLFQAAADHHLIASVACEPHHQPAIRRIAKNFPTVPILCHHLSGIRAGDDPHPHQAGLKEVLRSASVPNIYIKVSGFAYCSEVEWSYPYADTLWILRTLYEYFGPHRMCWGSDYPVVRFFMTYRQSLEIVRTHCTFISERDKNLILGGTLAGLLADTKLT